MTNEMKTLICLTSVLTLIVCDPAFSKTHGRQIVNPTEAMVTVPGIGPSRISTVRFCAHEAGVADYREAITDSEVEVLHSCLKENT